MYNKISNIISNLIEIIFSDNCNINILPIKIINTGKKGFNKIYKQIRQINLIYFIICFFPLIEEIK